MKERRYSSARERGLYSVSVWPARAIIGAPPASGVRGVGVSIINSAPSADGPGDSRLPAMKSVDDSATFWGCSLSLLGPPLFRRSLLPFGFEPPPPPSTSNAFARGLSLKSVERACSLKSAERHCIGN